jgi:hypothetical protein
MTPALRGSSSLGFGASLPGETLHFLGETFDEPQQLMTFDFRTAIGETQAASPRHARLTRVESH